MKSTLIRTKNWVLRNKLNIAFGVGLTMVIVGQARENKALIQFLNEKDLYNEYFSIPETTV